MPKSSDESAEEIARDMMRRSAVTTLSSRGVGSSVSSSVRSDSRGAKPAATRSRPMARRSSTCV